MIEAQQVSKMYTRGVYALRDITLTIGKGDFVFLTGPSGAGKSTLLRLLLRQDVPSAGHLIVGGRSLAKMSASQVQTYRRSVGFVFQDFKLIPTRTIYENITFVPRVLGQPVAVQRRKAFQVLKWVGLQHRLNAFPEELSGGEQQRVAVARALVNHPRVLLLDEPLGALDLKLRKEMQIELKRIQQEVGITFIHVTHDQEEAMTMADTIAVMHKGKIERLGAPVEIYEDPKTAFVAGFLGASNLMEGNVDGDGRSINLQDGKRIFADPKHLPSGSGAVKVGVRPEKVGLYQPGDEKAPANRLPGKVTDASFIGVSTQYLVDCGPMGELAVVLQNFDERRFAVGESVIAAWDPEHSFGVV